MPDAHTCRVQMDDTKVWCKDFGSGFGDHGGVNTVSQGFSPEEVIFTLLPGHTRTISNITVKS